MDAHAGVGLQRLGRFQALVQHPAVGVHGDVRTFPLHIGGTKRNREIRIVRHVALHRAIRRFVLEEDDRIRVAHRRAQHAGDVAGCGRDHDFQTRNMGVEGLHRLRVIERAVHTGAPGHADDERYAERVVRPVAHARGLVDDLLEGWRAEVGELDLGHWTEAADGRADGDPDDRCLGQWRIDDARRTELREEAFGHAKDTAALRHVFAENDVALVTPELAAQRLADGLHVRHFGHGFGNDNGYARYEWRRS